MGGPTEVAGNPAAAAQVAALLVMDRRLDRALTHGFHSYAGRMHPSTARGAIAAFSRPGDSVLDPFCGSGTVMVEALIAGRAAVGADASALAVALSNVRTTPLGAQGRLRLVDAAAAISDGSLMAARKRQRPPIPRWAADERAHFEPHVALELYGLRARVMENPDDDVGRALRLAFSSLLPKFMREAGERPGPRSDNSDDDAPSRRVARGLPSEFFLRRVEELARSLETLERAIPAGTPAPQIKMGDARSLPSLTSGRFALVVTSPPYAGTYDYLDLHAVRFRWLGLDEDELRERQLGSRGGSSAVAWRQSRRGWLGEMARLLAPAGHAVLIVGDGVVDHKPEDAATATITDAEQLGFEFVARASQPRPIHDYRLRTLFGAPTRNEHVLLLRKR